MAGFDKRSVSAYWTDAAEKDYEVFGLLLGAGKNCKALYSGHRVIENYLRAIFARRHNRHVPRHVNLCHLSYLCGPDISTEFSEWMDGICLFRTTERKGDFSREFEKKCTIEYTTLWADRIKIIRIWLKGKLLS